MRNGNWGLKDRAIIWIIQFQRLKMHDWIFFLPACGTKDAIFVWKIKFLSVVLIEEFIQKDCKR